MTELSNWKRCDSEDHMGTVNLITAAKRKHAAVNGLFSLNEDMAMLRPMFYRGMMNKGYPQESVTEQGDKKSLTARHSRRYSALEER